MSVSSPLDLPKPAESKSLSFKEKYPCTAYWVSGSNVAVIAKVAFTIFTCGIFMLLSFAYDLVFPPKKEIKLESSNQSSTPSPLQQLAPPQVQISVKTSMPGSDNSKTIIDSPDTGDTTPESLRDEGSPSEDDVPVKVQELTKDNLRILEELPTSQFEFGTDSVGTRSDITE